MSGDPAPSTRGQDGSEIAEHASGAGTVILDYTQQTIMCNSVGRFCMCQKQSTEASLFVLR